VDRDQNQARPELEQALAYYRDLYDRAPVGYLLLDAQGGVRDIDRTGADLLDDRGLFCPHLGELQEHEGRRSRKPLRRPSTRAGSRPTFGAFCAGKAASRSPDRFHRIAAARTSVRSACSAALRHGER